MFHSDNFPCIFPSHFRMGELYNSINSLARSFLIKINARSAWHLVQDESFFSHIHLNITVWLISLENFDLLNEDIIPSPHWFYQNASRLILIPIFKPFRRWTKWADADGIGGNVRITGMIRIPTMNRYCREQFIFLTKHPHIWHEIKLNQSIYLQNYTWNDFDLEPLFLEMSEIFIDRARRTVRF